ncbi:IS3 family transposase [Candidatus Saccharibacteria bacterium]|nr:MAG: IS3 family transposase [Candidatus Saccharibacteria bacterium]
MIRFRFVQDNMTELPVKRMCELAEIPRSSFYAWLTRKPSARDITDEALLVTIRDIYARSRKTYGVPRMLGQLQRRGHRVARSHVARLMRANGLVGAHASKKWRRGRPDAGGVPDLLSRDFRAVAPNQRWVADITEFPTGEGKLYLAGIRDLFHRGIVGWDTAGRQDAALVVSALTMALARTGHPGDVIHHSDKGSQYTSLDFAFAAGNADMQLSFGSTGDAFDNAAMETAWARLKVEIAWIRGSIWFPTRAECHAYLFEFIEVFYNRQRHQTGLGHLTPAEYADQWRHDHGQPNLA